MSSAICNDFSLEGELKTERQWVAQCCARIPAPATPGTVDHRKVDMHFETTSQQMAVNRPSRYTYQGEHDNYDSLPFCLRDLLSDAFL